MTECYDYSGIKLMCHGMKLYERLVEDRQRQVIEISSTQYGSLQGTSTTEPIFALRMMQEKHLEKKTKPTHDLCRSRKCIHDRVPIYNIWRALRKKNVGEEYIKAIQDILCRPTMDVQHR